MQHQKFEPYNESGKGLFKLGQIEAQCTWTEKGRRQNLDSGNHGAAPVEWKPGAVRKDVTITVTFDGMNLKRDEPAMLVDLYKSKRPGIPFVFSLDGRPFECELTHGDTHGPNLLLTFFTPQFMSTDP